MAGWDNTPRRWPKGYLFYDATPDKFETWLSALVIRTHKRFGPGERFVFINAWNEWGEGCYLEPDAQFGRGYLEATRAALDHRERVVAGARGFADGRT